MWLLIINSCVFLYRHIKGTQLILHSFPTFRSVSGISHDLVSGLQNAYFMDFIFLDVARTDIVISGYRCRVSDCVLEDE